MSEALQDRRIAFLVANDGAEQVELTEPWQAVERAGGTPTLIAPDAGTVLARHHLDPGDRFDVDRALADARVEDFDALVLPGGVANPDELRTRPEAVRLIRSFAEAGKPIAAICHAPWTLIDAGLVRDRRLTSWPSLRTDITNAGGEWIDEEVVVSDDGPSTLITSRRPDDLPAFCRELTRAFAATGSAETSARA
jgi:protease I